VSIHFSLLDVKCLSNWFIYKCVQLPLDSARH
jgi:hypothetical protein